MSNRSKIAWTDKTWNPVVGCGRVSTGCEHCYAEKSAARLARIGRTAERYKGLTEVGAHGARWTGIAREVPEMLDRPLRWKKPRLVFVNSMSDLFHDDISDEFILRVFDVMRSCLTAEANVWPESHAFQVLTKRPERMRDLMKRMRFDGRGTGTMSLHEPGTRDSGYGIMGGRPGCPPLPNVWLGVTAENQEMADERIPLLLDTPAAVRFVSAEPLLGPIDFEAMESKLDWIIVGGESGLGARPCAVEWIRSIVEQCGESEVACFVKQLGARPIFFPGDPITGYEGIAQPIEQRHSKGGDPVEWPEDLRVQEYPTTGEPGR